MGLYILRRLVMLVPILLGVTMLTFLIIQVTPGDPVALMLGEYASEEEIAVVRSQLGLDDPLLVQYARYVKNAAQGDLGVSIRSRAPVTDEILARFPSTLELALAGMAFAVLVGVTVGIVASTTRRRVIDSGTMLVSLFGLSTPSFFLGIALLLLFGVRLQWVSVIGGEGLKDLILPAFCLAVGPAARLARLTRSSMLEVIGENYVQVARAKGLRERIVIWRHALRNALIPILTAASLLFAAMLNGAVFIESVFARPGLGRFAVNAVANRDYPQVQGIALFLATIYVLINLAVDILYGILDPRIRTG
jgi:ABC-type dipeptide/oligopeptide/nickel transport system permease component